MRTIAIIGGKLQGIEAAYLAKKAKMKSIVIDKNPNAPAAKLCDVFYSIDVKKDQERLIEILNEADCILPAVENNDILSRLVELSEKKGWVLLFDQQAYSVSSSKLKSDQMFYDIGVPAPVRYPACKAPYIVKPPEGSGSAGVRRIETEKKLEDFLSGEGTGVSWTIQEYLEGRSYSIEVIGFPGNYRTYAVTEIHMDEVYDCKMVSAPCPELSREQKNAFARIGVKLADAVGLHGIMDVETIFHNGMFKVLEIDARFPSQTPCVVYHSSGMNLLEELADVFLEGKFLKEHEDKQRFCALEHWKVTPDGISPHGEHIMSVTKNLKYYENFLGADEVLCDIGQSKGCMHGTFINSADSQEELLQKRRDLFALLEAEPILGGCV